jgi:hypothetical protein
LCRSWLGANENALMTGAAAKKIQTTPPFHYPPAKADSTAAHGDKCNVMCISNLFVISVFSSIRVLFHCFDCILKVFRVVKIEKISQYLAEKIQKIVRLFDF